MIVNHETNTVTMNPGECITIVLPDDTEIYIDEEGIVTRETP